jgi:hypothetical protein
MIVASFQPSPHPKGGGVTTKLVKDRRAQVYLAGGKTTGVASSAPPLSQNRRRRRMKEETAKYKIGDEDEMELYQEFFKKMLDFGYAPFFIGEKLAYIVKAVELSEPEEKHK